LSEAKEQAQEIIRRAERREVEMIEEAKNSARVEGERILVAAKSEIEKEANIAREALRGQVAALAVAGAAKILSREVDQSAHARMLDDLTAEL
jgi:F-type H+-transporting ATPase subunit b